MGDLDKVRFNAVQLDRIFAEAVDREKRDGKLSTQFCLNPAALKYVAPKPVNVDPVAMVQASRAQVSSSLPSPASSPLAPQSAAVCSPGLASGAGSSSPLQQTGRTLTSSQSDPSLITDDVLSLMHKKARSPKEKYLEPVLSSHTVGWNLEHARAFQRRNERWRRPKGTCDVTSYATAYYTLYGTTPYSKPLPQAD